MQDEWRTELYIVVSSTRRSAKREFTGDKVPNTAMPVVKSRRCTTCASTYQRAVISVTYSLSTLTFSFIWLAR